MKENENTAVVRRWFEELWNQRKLQTIDELLADDALCYDMTAPDSVLEGREAFKAAAKQLLAAFGEIHMKIEDIFGVDDRVAVRVTGELHLTGPLGELKATNAKVTVPIMCIVHVRDGKLVAGWNNWDIPGVLRAAAAPPERRALF